MKRLRIGILGGIGPKASGYFYLRLIRLLQESGHIKSNHDFPQIIINSIPAPELVDLEIQKETLDQYIEGILELASIMPDFIVMACNTIHLFRDYLIDQTGYSKILSLRDIVKEHLDTQKNVSPLCVIGTPATVIQGLFDYPEYTYHNPTKEELSEIGHIIKAYNAGGNAQEARNRLMQIIQREQGQKVRTFLFACSEVSNLLRYKPIHSIDTFEVLIQATAKICLGERAIVI